ncbi:helix-turn-helix transcriptional regulator [Irregularibacter muris]|uniref:Helix-turn-helix transcriptional regulator n=1 Tax=Irregularibacter muris TaxID=1796619 RepID=A0AAE3L2M3_9FIRM|nr:helix-turn-helix transcriptional regulator [Irregularibacter muris]MCR1898844.1 helix-turn-helix transcriptional regulator [Irregularibacter muris]
MKINKELMKGSTMILVLSLLEQESMYGYQMIKKIEEKSSGVFTFKEGTLYPILHSLESDGLVESFWDHGDSGRKRKYYRITKKGKTSLRDKQEEWRLFRRTVDQVLGEGLV